MKFPKSPTTKPPIGIAEISVMAMRTRVAKPGEIDLFLLVRSFAFPNLEVTIMVVESESALRIDTERE